MNFEFLESYLVSMSQKIRWRETESLEKRVLKEMAPRERYGRRIIPRRKADLSFKEITEVGCSEK